jgi:hypothetical protein
MAKRKPPGMQGQSFESIAKSDLAVEGSLAVVGVSNDGMPQVLQVPAHLMKAAGPRSRFHEAQGSRSYFGGFKFRVVGLSLHPRASFGARHRVIDKAASRWYSPHKRQVALVYQAQLEGRRESRDGVGSKSQKKHAAGPSVQAMNRRG